MKPYVTKHFGFFLWKAQREMRFYVGGGTFFWDDGAELSFSLGKLNVAFGLRLSFKKRGIK